MPILISEIEINIEVTPNNNSRNNSFGPSDNGPSPEAIIRECVEEVMEIINQKNER